MPVEPIPCADGGGSTPVEITTCCSPSISSAPLCRADGSTVLAVVQSGCVECGGAAEDPAVVGWLDVAGVFTAGALPADVGPCEAGCVDTVCRQRCDDTDGDGEADATYSELWCIRLDGAAELVLTYQDDPALEYVPVSPVECVYGSQDTETVPLCDTAPDGTVTPFLRRYTFLDGIGTYEDIALDGQTPHIVTGTVGLCDTADSCAEPTTPAATLGLCLADGTPIAVVVTRDCDGVVNQDGWLNLTTGTWSAGDPPVGTMACGNPRSISTTGTFCDIDPGTGDVLGLVLIEYTYGADGAVASVRLVDATTGQTYTPQGEVTTCPAGVEQPERDVLQLCDTATDGTRTAFLRDYGRDENGAITGHTDYTLDGAPYTPAGTVGLCEQPCQDCETLALCDVDANPPATIAGTAASGTLPNGVAWTSTGPSALPPTRQGDGAAWWGLALFPNPSVPTNLWTFDQPVSVEFSVAMDWSPATGPTENQVLLPAGAVPISLPSGYTYDRTTRILRADNTLTGCTILAPTRAASARFRVTRVTSLTLRYLGSRAVNAECRTLGHWVFGALDVSLGGPFLRTVCRDCTGDLISNTDTLLDGTTPYTPVGTVGVCQPPAADETPCRDSSQTLLCDLAALDTVTVLDTVGVQDADGWELTAFNAGSCTGYNPPDGPVPGPPHWSSGGYLGARADRNLGAGSCAGAWNGYDAAPIRWILTKTFVAPQDGTAVVTADGFAADGGARVRVNGQDVGLYGQWNQPAVGGSSQVPVTAGPNVVEIEVRDIGGPNWLRGHLDVVMTRTRQFMRKVVTDCATGETISVTDTTLDGDPYTVTGEVGHCEPVAECCEQPPPETRLDVETEMACLLDEDGASLGQVLVERVYDDQSGLRTEQRLLDPTTGEEVPLPAGATLGNCPAETVAADCRNTSTLLVCDLPVDGAPAATLTDTSGAPYYPYTTGVATAGAQALWDGGTLTLADAATPQPGTGGTVRTAAAVLQAPRPVCDAGTARVTVHVDVTQLGPDAGCANTGFLGLYNGPGEANRVALALAPLNTPAGWSGTLSVEADVPAADLAAGDIAVLVAFDAYDDSGTACPPPRHTGWQLSEFAATVAYDQAGCTTQFLRNVTVDCETGTVTSVTDTTLDGAPYAVTGEAGQCTPASSGGTVEPCGDTEVVQLCDLTYDPQAPIPTPAGDFTLTGNVVAGNSGTTLWFAQANQPATGVAELTVGALLPATLYEFRFASAWIGAGGADPVGNAAIYRLDVLDGATVLATRTRNVSNGSNVFPGGVLSEDMPPLAFIAPATGAVTIRFTDLTTGGGTNDRDLFLMPFEVRTAVLTLNRTPFLRRLTFDCDGGLVSTQDLDVDGFTPYVVEGEAGHCTADGAAAGPVTPCDVQNVIQACRCDDADGDGLADTDYVELSGVDCEGVLTPLGTYLPDLSAPYAPVAPIDCDQVDEGAPPAAGVQARRVELAAGASWSAAAHPMLQSVTAVAHGGTGTVTTADGTSTLHTSEAATWSVGRLEDALLTGPLTVTAATGTVTITFTTGVTL